MNFTTNGFRRLLNFMQVIGLSVAMNGKFNPHSTWVLQQKSIKRFILSGYWSGHYNEWVFAVHTT